MKAVWDFLYCTGTGLLAGALFVLVVVGGLFALAIVGDKIKSWIPKSENVGKYVALSILLPALLIVCLLAAHDFGCDLHGHPEHKLFLDKGEPHHASH